MAFKQKKLTYFSHVFRPLPPWPEVCLPLRASSQARMRSTQGGTGKHHRGHLVSTVVWDSPRRLCLSLNCGTFSPRSSCRAVEVEKCRTRIPGCKARECTKRPRRRCRIVTGSPSSSSSRSPGVRRCPEPACGQYPVRKCQPCPPRQFCHDHLERACRREPREECFPGDKGGGAQGDKGDCSPRCSTAYICPICR